MCGNGNDGISFRSSFHFSRAHIRDNVTDVYFIFSTSLLNLGLLLFYSFPEETPTIFESCLCKNGLKSVFWRCLGMTLPSY